MYPHIIDAIFAYAPTASLLVLRQTCHALRDRALESLFKHVIFIPSNDQQRVHVLLGAAPYTHLGGFRLLNTLAVRPDVDRLPGLAYTRVLDVDERPWGWYRSSVPLPQLRTLRRLTYPGDSRSIAAWHGRLYPPVHTLVDYVDFSGIYTPSGIKRHILHLTWTEGGPEFRYLERPNAQDRTLVLHTTDNRAEGGAITRLLHLLSTWQPRTIVGAERTRGSTLEAIMGWKRDKATTTARGTVFKTYEEWAASLESIENPASEIMDGYHLSEDMRRARNAANRHSY
jgi:hypothetical protein